MKVKLIMILFLLLFLISCKHPLNAIPVEISETEQEFETSIPEPEFHTGGEMTMGDCFDSGGIWKSTYGQGNQPLSSTAGTCG